MTVVVETIAKWHGVRQMYQYARLQKHYHNKQL